MDLPNYVSGCSGYMYYARLFFIAEHDQSLMSQALKLAHDYIKKYTFDTQAYNRIFQMLARQHSSRHANPSNDSGEFQLDCFTNTASNPFDERNLPSAAGETRSLNGSITAAERQALRAVMSGINDAGLTFDTHWEESTKRKAMSRLEELNTELKNLEANRINESIRRGSDDLGDLYLKMGNLTEAQKYYTPRNNYHTSTQQQITICLNVIKIAIYKGRWDTVKEFVGQAFKLPDIRDSTSLRRPQDTISDSRASTSGLSTTANGPGERAVRDHSRMGTDSLVNQRQSARKFSDMNASAGTFGGQNYRDAIAQYKSRLAIADGLYNFFQSDFRMAVNKFLQVNPDHCESEIFSVITKLDLAYLITLCSLAVFDRGELTNQVVNNAYVRVLLESQPDCRDILESFYGAKYGICLNRLVSLRPFFRRDYFLKNYAETLCQSIRNRAFSQYFSTYMCANLNLMAQAFAININELQNELTALIQQGIIKARIDSQKQLLRVLNVDERSLTFSRALQLVEEYKKRTQSMILRISLTQHKLVFQDNRDESSRPTGSHYHRTTDASTYYPPHL